MSGTSWVGDRLGFAAFGTSVGLAVLLGALSVAVPGLVAVTGTLAALAVAGWATLPRRLGPTPWARRGAVSLVGCALLLGAAAYLLPPVFLVPYRGLAIALGLVPLWLLERRGRPRRSARGVPA